MFSEKPNILKESLSIIDGVFLLFLAISGNFIAETLSCQTQKLFTNSIIAKQIMTFFIIFFTIDYSDNAKEAPYIKLTKASMIYVFFLLFTKMNLKPTILVFIILFAIYLLKSYKNYYEAIFKEIKKPTKEETNNHKKQINNFFSILQILMCIIIIIILVGFFMYFQEKKVEYKDSFNFKNFIFGVIKCKGMN